MNVYNCGFRSGVIEDSARRNWQDTGPRPIHWATWYPTEDVKTASSPAYPFFETGAVVANARPVRTRASPIVLLSHGTGGTAQSLGWIARGLVKKGFVVLAANHHGNTGLEPYCAEGFLCWWERAQDLNLLLSRTPDVGLPDAAIDKNKVSAVGFSLGGYTVLALAGARTSLQAFDQWRRKNNIEQDGPREFPNAASEIPTLLKNSHVFRQSWERHGDDFSNPLVKSIVAIAPAPTVRGFTEASVQMIRRPVTLIGVEADAEAPFNQCVQWLARYNSRFKAINMGKDVGHYTFLDMPADRSLLRRDPLFTDLPGVARETVHAECLKAIHSALITR